MARYDARGVQLKVGQRVIFLRVGRWGVPTLEPGTVVAVHGGGASVFGDKSRITYITEQLVIVPDTEPESWLRQQLRALETHNG